MVELTENAKEPEPFTFNLTFFIGLYFLMAFLGFFPSVLAGYWYFTTFPFSFDPLYILTLIPLFFALYGIALLSLLFWTKVGIWIVHKRITPPLHGSYPRTMDHPQVRAHVMKGNLKGLGMWAYYFFHLPFLRAFWLRRMGVKIGKNVRLAAFIQDEEFIEIGDNCFFGTTGTIISGHMMDQNFLTIHPTIIGKNCIFENRSGAVGSIIGDNSIITAITGVMKGQICRGNSFYHGVPCKKVKDNDLSPEEITELKESIQQDDKTNFIKRKNAVIQISGIKLFLIKIAIVIGGILFGLILPILYALFFQAFYSPTNHLINIALLTLVPAIFLINLAFFIMGTTIFTKIFLAYYDRKAEIPEGYYEVTDPRAKLFKLKYLLRLFGLRLFDGTPFKLANIFALKLWGNVELGKNVKIADATVDPQYIEIGDYSNIASFTRIHTHYFINGKLFIKKVKIGKNVLVGAYTHIKPGVEIADGSVTAVGAWFRKNRKCKRPALWLGKPAAELPLSLMTRSARLEGKYVD